MKLGALIPFNIKKKMRNMVLDAEAKKITRLIRRRKINKI